MTTAQLQAAAIQMIAAVAEAIRELGSVPNGHLYARLTGKLSLESYNNIIMTLEKAKLVENKNDLLTWVGPEIKPQGPVSMSFKVKP